jgi:hypothetical protein
LFLRQQSSGSAPDKSLESVKQLINTDSRHDGTKPPLPRLGYYRKGWRLHVDHAIRWRIARATDRAARD